MPVKSKTASYVILGVSAVLCTACRDHDSSATVAASPASSHAKALTRVALPPITPADEHDDPDAAGKLPGSGTVGDWTKTRPAEVIEPANACRTLTADHAAVCEAYRLRFAASAGYTRRDDPQRREVTLTMLELDTVEDAIGLFLAASPGATLTDFASTTSAVHVCNNDGNAVWSAWRGQRVVRIVGQASQESLERLGGRLLLATPAAPVPSTLPLHALEGQSRGQLRIVRTVATLADASTPELRFGDPALVDRLLGLTGDTWLVCAGFSAPDTDEINHVFAVRYPSAEAATAAHARCIAAVARGEMAAILIEPVHGVLAGSWTPGVESLSRQLISVRRRLKGEEVASVRR